MQKPQIWPFKTKRRCCLQLGIVCTCCLDVIKHDLSLTEVHHTRCYDQFHIQLSKLTVQKRVSLGGLILVFNFHLLNQFLSHRLLFQSSCCIGHSSLCIHLSLTFRYRSRSTQTSWRRRMPCSTSKSWSCSCSTCCVWPSLAPCRM